MGSEPEACGARRHAWLAGMTNLVRVRAIGLGLGLGLGLGFGFSWRDGPEARGDEQGADHLVLADGRPARLVRGGARVRASA